MAREALIRRKDQQLKTYEAVVIFPPEASGLDGKTVFEDLVKKNEGKILNRLEMGKRFLGYSVKKTKEAYVVAFDFELAPSKVDALKRLLDLNEDIIKYTLVVKPKHKILLSPSPAPAVSEKR